MPHVSQSMPHAREGPRYVRRLHRDETGTISILTVFAVLMLAALLGMVMNVGRQVDGKIRMQNAADATAYSGALVVARGMNALAFTNHLLFDVFALTAFCREARDQHSDKYVPEILAAWKKAGEQFQKSSFPKFQRLGTAIIQQAPLEQALVDAFSGWAKAVSEILLPTLEQILQDEMIPQFQRAVVAAYPDMAQQAALEAALANGRPEFGRGNLCGVLWRTNVVPVGGAGEGYSRTLPVIDPVLDSGASQSQRMREAREQRLEQAKLYLGVGRGPTSGPSWHGKFQAWWYGNWNDQVLAFFDQRAKMCQFATLWRGFTCGQLEKLCDEYPESNLPHLIATHQDEVADINTHLDQHFTLVGVAYWNPIAEYGPRIFDNPMPASAVTFAQVRVFVPHRKLVWLHGGAHSWSEPIGGVPGQFPPLPPPGDGETDPPTRPDAPENGTDDGGGSWTVGREPGVVESWDLLNEHWTVSLVPATVATLPEILHEPPSVPGFGSQQFRLPDLGGIGMDRIGWINTH